MLKPFHFPSRFLAGTTTTNFSYTLSYAGVTNAPTLTVLWPPNNAPIGGSNVTIQAQISDATATVTATISSNTVQGLIERSGLVWLQNLPLNGGTNVVTITTTSAAGNSSTNTLNVVESTVSLTIDPISDDQLNQSSITVTGAVSSASYNVWVNGVQATVSGDPVWEATNVPVSATGTASLLVQVGTDLGHIIAAQTLNQLQPARVVLSSYSAHLSGAGMGAYGPFSYQEDDNWTYPAGGNEAGYYDSTAQFGGPFDQSWSTGFAAGDGGFDPIDSSEVGTWENVSTSSWYSRGYDEKQIQTHVMIEPPGQQGIGSTALYLVMAQVINEDTGLQLAAEGVQFVNQLAGTATEDVTNDDGSVWSQAIVVAASGAPAEATPLAAGNVSFTGMKTAKTKEDWQQEVQQEIDADSGVAIENYLAANGFMNNRTNIQAVYAFYQKLFTEEPDEFYWAGLAKLAGAPVYAGLSDAEYVKDGLITSGYLTLDDLGATIASALLESKASQFQTDLIEMNIHIYQDMDWQFEAYKNGGLDALEEINAVNNSALDIDAWRKIDEGIQDDNDEEIQEGNTLLAQREQNIVLADDYANLSSLFPGTTSLMSVFAQNPVVGGPSFSSLEPGEDIANYTYRWDWVSRSYTSITNTGIFPLWLHESDSTRLLDVQQPLLYRAQNDFSLAYEYFGLTIY